LSKGRAAGSLNRFDGEFNFSIFLDRYGLSGLAMPPILLIAVLTKNVWHTKRAALPRTR